MFSQLRGRSAKILLWLLALAVLCFIASLFPEVRKRLPWFEDDEASLGAAASGSVAGRSPERSAPASPPATAGSAVSP